MNVQPKPAQQPPPGFGRGLDWLRQGSVLLAAQPLRLLLLGLVLQLLAGVSQAGVLGFVFLLVAPAFGAGMLQAMQLVRAGGRPTLASLFVAFAAPASLGRLVLLGALGIGFAIIAMAMVLSGAAVEFDPALLQRLEAGDASAVTELDPALLQGALLGLGFGMLLAGTLAYYAVPLSWFRGLSVGRAIVQGLAGMVRAWRPLLVLGLMLGLLSLPGAILLAFSLLGGVGQSVFLTLPMLLLVVAFQLLLFATQYVSFVDIFGAPENPPQPLDQLVA